MRKKSRSLRTTLCLIILAFGLGPVLTTGLIIATNSKSIGMHEKQTIINSEFDIITSNLNNNIFTYENALSSFEGNKDRFWFILNNDGQLLANNSGIEFESNNAAEIFGNEICSKLIGETKFNIISYNNSKYMIKSVKANDCYICSFISMKLVYSFYYEIIELLILSLCSSTILCIFFGIFASSKIVKPIKEVADIAEEIANGNFNINVKTKAKGEIGELIDSFKDIGATLHTYKSYIDEVSLILDNIAVGNMNFELCCEYKGEFTKIKNSIDHIKENLSTMIYNIKNGANNISLSSSQVALSAHQLSEGATEQASTIEELSASISEISNQININAENAKRANALAKQTGENMKQSFDQIKNMLAAIDNIEKSSNEIGNVNKTIESIALQTNILALNAAVEAARAGNAGKGFAVVADEVRNLVQKTTEAAKGTSMLINKSINAITDGSRIANQTSDSMIDVLNQTESIIELINEIAEASLSQSSYVAALTSGIEQISSVIQINSASSEESAATSEELNNQVILMKREVDKFRFEESSFEGSLNS